MNILVGAENPQLQGDINAIQVYGNVYNGPTEVTNTAGASWKGIDLLHQHTSAAALLDARARRDPPRCMEKTREAIIQEILDWVKKLTDSSSIFWLRGPAGHGKTALMFTIAEICRREGLLIGSFFFSNSIANCSDASFIFSTLAAELIQAYPSTRYYIDKAIREDPHIFDKALEMQMKALIVEPVQYMASMADHTNTVTFERKSYPILIVIDGLDECADPDDQDEIVRIIGDLAKQRGLPLRFLIASRPEPNIREAFEKLQSRLSKDSFSTLLLTEDALTRRDIQIYFKRKFDELRARHSYLPAGWPGPNIIMRLVDKASGQFVYATTIFIYVSSRDDRPYDRLNMILKMLDIPVGDTPYAPLDQLYRHIVRTVKHRTEVLLILGQLILAKEMPNEKDVLGSPSNSTSQKRIEVILNLRVGDVERLLNRMHSVIDVVEDLKLLHASFQDFLLDPSRSEDFAVNLPEARLMLGLAYLQAICTCSSEVFNNQEPTRRIQPDLLNAHKALQNNYSFSQYSKCTGDLGDVSCAIMISAFRSAIQLTRYDHPNLPVCLSNLAKLLSRLFERTGDPTYINSAILVQQTAILLTPNGHADMPGLLNNLGNSFRSRFGRIGDISDVSEAISVLQQAAQIAPNDHPNMSSLLNDLGNSYFSRFECTGDVSDISEVISVQQRAVQITPNGHADMPGMLNSLGNSLRSRFECTGDVSDVSEAISAQQRAVQITPDGHANMPGRLNDIGISYLARFEHTGDVSDVSEAISVLRQAVQLIPNSHPNMPGLNSLENLFHSRFEHTGDVSDVSEAISVQQRAVQITPNGHADIPGLLNSLGNTFRSRFERTGNISDLYTATSTFRKLATTFGPLSTRLYAAQQWAQLSQISRLSETLMAYGVAVDLITQIACLDRTIQQRHVDLIKISNLTTSAVLVAFALGKVEKALDWLEQGRCLVWSQLNQLHTPLDHLRTHNKLLARQFSEFSGALEMGSRRGSEHLDIDATVSQETSLQDEAHHHARLSHEWSRLLDEIRCIPQFHDFLRPLQVSYLLKHLPPDGIVILVNIQEDRCDALALISGVEGPLHIPLNNFTHKEASELRERLHRFLSSNGIRFREANRRGSLARPHDVERQSDVYFILKQLWLLVVWPILEPLAYSSPATSELARIWWCPTSSLAFLPLHAAGVYSPSGRSSPGSCISDFAVSSYIPTVSWLLEKLKESGDVRQPSLSKLLIIGQPNTPGCSPMPAATKEIDCISKVFGSFNGEHLRLEGESASLTRVNLEMESHGSVHLACHGTQDLENPLKSGFYLHDGWLELADIMKQKFAVRELAFLSACEMSTSSKKLSEEGVYLASGMLAAGYRSVVATMWSVDDQYGPMVAESFYTYLMERGKTSEGLRLDSSHAAYALHHTIQDIREKLGDTEQGLLTWVACIGRLE